jgi:hypothetical protein
MGGDHNRRTWRKLGQKHLEQGVITEVVLAVIAAEQQRLPS